MKKFLILSALCLMAASYASAQQLEKNHGLLNVGMGFGPGIGANISYDHGIIDTWGPGTFTVGGFVGFNVWSDSYYAGRSYDYNQTDFSIAPRATYRYGINESFEVYAAAMMGVLFRSYSVDYYKGETTVAVGGTVGCRYSFSKSISVFAEAGFNSVSYVNGGLSFHF